MKRRYQVWLPCVVILGGIVAGVWIGLSGTQELTISSPAIVSVPSEVLRLPESTEQVGCAESSVEQLTDEQEAEVREAEAFFAEHLPHYLELGTGWNKRRRDLLRDQPLALQAAEYGRTFRNDTRKRHKEIPDLWDEYSKTRLKSLGVLHQKQRELSLPGAVLEALASKDKIGNATLAALMEDLLANTQYFDLLKSSLLKAEQSHAGESLHRARLTQIKTPDELVAELREMNPSFQRMAAENMAQISPDPRFREYLADITYANWVFGMMQDYRKSWWAEVDEMGEQIQTLDSQMRSRLGRLPREEPRVQELAQQLHDAVAALQQTSEP